MRFVSYYSRAISDTSGVTAALWAWARALMAAGHEVLVVHAGGRRRSPDPLGDSIDPPDRAIAHVGRNRTTFVPTGLAGVLRPDDVLLLHEGWVASNLVAAATARIRRVPYVVVPHGVYEPGIVASLKRPVAVRTAAERRMLEAARAVHVFWPSEVNLVRNIAPRSRVVVAPTGFDLTDHRWSGGGGYVAWLGRYDPTHKGLDLLLEGLANIDASRRPRLRMHGTDYSGGLAVVRNLVGHLGLEPWVTVEGPVYGIDKERFLAAADAYVHPSRWESHSIALLETLSLGVPAVVSASIHIAPTLAAHDAAVVVRPTPRDLAAGLLEVLEVRQAGIADRARAFIAEEMRWQRAVDRFVRGIAQPRDPAPSLADEGASDRAP